MEYLDWWSKYHASNEEQGGVEKPINKLLKIVKEISGEKIGLPGADTILPGASENENVNNETMSGEDGDTSYSDGGLSSSKKKSLKRKMKQKTKRKHRKMAAAKGHNSLKRSSSKKKRVGTFFY